MDEPTVEVIDWPDILKSSEDDDKALSGLLADMDRPNILSTILYCGGNPIPQREPPNEDDEKALSGLLSDE